MAGNLNPSSEPDCRARQRLSNPKFSKTGSGICIQPCNFGAPRLHNRGHISFVNIKMPTPGEWKDFLKDRSAIGLCTILYMHMTAYLDEESHKDQSNKLVDEGEKIEEGKAEEEGKKEKEEEAKQEKTKEHQPEEKEPKENPWRLRCLLFSVLFAQITLPVVLLVYAILDNGNLNCGDHYNFDAGRMLTALAVGFVYVFRIDFTLGSKSSEPPALVYRDKWNDPCLRCCLCIDTFMNTAYEVLVYLCNLAIVFFLTKKPFDMVVNSLAFEFILQFDDFAKKKYIAIYSDENWQERDTLIYNYQATFEIGSEGGGKEAKELIDRFGKPYKMLFYFTSYLLPFIPVIAVFVFIPLCQITTVNT